MQKEKKVRMLNFPERGDDRGHLVIMEGEKDIPLRSKGHSIFMDLKRKW